LPIAAISADLWVTLEALRKYRSCHDGSNSVWCVVERLQGRISRGYRPITIS
jgi:hypothetical protein